MKLKIGKKDSGTTSSETTEEIESRRQSLIDSIGLNQMTLGTSKDQAVAWACGYYMLLMFLAMFSLFVVPIRNPDLRLIYIVASPLPFCGAIGWSIWRKTQGQSIVFDSKGFQVLDRHQVTFDFKWYRIKEVEALRTKLVFHLHDGSNITVEPPNVKVSRDGQVFREILTTYAVKRDSTAMKRKWFVIFLVMLVISLLALALIGRPEMLSKDYEGPIGAPQYFSVAVWSVAGCLLMASAHGLMFLFASYFMKRETNKALSRVSRFGPNVQEYLDQHRGWPKPTILETGKSYRYLDPDGVRLAIKDSVTGMWIISICSWLLGLMAPVSYFVAPHIRNEDVASLIVMFLICFIAGLIPLWFLPGFRRRMETADDVILVESNSLLVSRGTESFRYPRNPVKGMKDELAKKEQRRPFGRTERYGANPDSYLIDRRYLLEVNKNVDL